MKFLRRLLTALLGTGLLAGFALVAPQAAGAAPTSGASTQRGAGIEVRSPGGNHEWLGQYVVGGKPVFCVDYALRAPGADEHYKRGQVLRTKWGGRLSAARASDISYLLLRYGTTDDEHTAAALAHLLHSWTAPVTAKHPGDPNDPLFQGHGAGWVRQNLAYDSKHYRAALPSAVRAKADTLEREAASNRAPWKLAIDPPKQPRVNKADAWTLRLTSGEQGSPVRDVPVTLRAEQATVDSDAGKATTGKVTTGKDGTARFEITPTGAEPAVTASLRSPNGPPRVQVPLDHQKVQKVVLGGGEQNLTETSKIRGGGVRVSKTDADSGKGIAGAALRITGGDKRSPATSSGGEKLTGKHGKPVVLRTGAGGHAQVRDLAAAQRVCVIETEAPKGYEQSFDRSHPPSACGTIQAGKTLELRLSNQANAVVPVTIPAGGSAPTASTASETRTVPSSYGLFGFGAAVMLSAAIGATFLTRRRQRR